MRSRRGRGRNLRRFVTERQLILRGWINYFRLSEVKGIFEELDGWIRRHLRCVLWRQWKRRYTRVNRLMKYGISEDRAWRSDLNGRGPWWNSGASHMNQVFPKKFFDRLGLVSLRSIQKRNFLPDGAVIFLHGFIYGIPDQKCVYFIRL